MCFVKDLANKPKTPKSPWRRLKQVRPRLSRRVVPGARVNLNDFWAKLESTTEIAKITTPTINQIAKHLINDGNIGGGK